MDRNFEFMFYGFTAAWLIVIIYVIWIALRERRLRDELDRVKRMVETRSARLRSRADAMADADSGTTRAEFARSSFP